METISTWWKDWQNHPNTDFAHFQLVCRLRNEVLGPHAAVVERDGKPCALLAARLERTHFVPAIGYFKPLKLPATVLCVLHQGLLGQIGEEIGEELVRYVWNLLYSGEADVAHFSHLPENSPLLKALLVHKPRWLGGKKPMWSVHWDMELTGEQGFILKKMKPKHRAWIRGRERKLTLAFKGKVSWRWIDRFDDLPQLCARIEEVAARTYHRGLGAGFVDNEEHRQRFALFASRGQLRVQVLEIERKLRAFWIGTVYRGVFYSSETGYDPDLRVYMPGTLILLRMVDELVREGVKKIDFGLGDAFYKQRFGDRCWREGTLRLFAPSAKGLILKSTLGLFDIMDGAARRLFQRTELLDRVKTGWRRRIASTRQKTREK